MYLLGVHDCVCMGHSVHMADNYVSPGIEFTSSGMVASLFAQWAILLASNYYFKTLKESLFRKYKII